MLKLGFKLKSPGPTPMYAKQISSTTSISIPFPDEMASGTCFKVIENYIEPGHRWAIGTALMNAFEVRSPITSSDVLKLATIQSHHIWKAIIEGMDAREAEEERRKSGYHGYNPANDYWANHRTHGSTTTGGAIDVPAEIADCIVE